MPEVPNCLNRRYKAINDLVDDIHNSSNKEQCEEVMTNNDVGINLMCKFWDILNDAPGLDLKSEVLKRFMIESKTSLEEKTTEKAGVFENQEFFCYVASDQDPNKPGKDGSSTGSGKSEGKAKDRKSLLCCAKKRKGSDSYEQSSVTPGESQAGSTHNDANDAANEFRLQANEMRSQANEMRLQANEMRSQADEMRSQVNDARSRNVCVDKPPGDDRQSVTSRTSGKSVCCKPPDRQRSGDVPLCKVLNDLNEAATFEKRCMLRINDLLETQDNLLQQVKYLEEKEKNGQKLLKEVDGIWTAMEEGYKQQIDASVKKQKALMEELKQIEESTDKWKKAKCALEAQADNISKCEKEVTDKINKRKTELKTYEVEIKNFEKKANFAAVEVKKITEAFAEKQAKADEKLKALCTKLQEAKKAVDTEKTFKEKIETDGNNIIKGARQDLADVCKVMLQKKLEYEDLLSEKNELEEEIKLIKATANQCKERCKNRELALNDEKKKLDAEIAAYKNKCVQCHKYGDTSDRRKYCSGCPKCLNDKDCLIKVDHCETNPEMECVCLTVKQKFIENVLDNMNTVLLKHTDTREGKALAGAILEGLKKSRNGKVDGATKRDIQAFVANVLKKEINITIVGGAVKTRCELDKPTYTVLMKCLKSVSVNKSNTDKGVDVKKPDCTRFDHECNCAGGPQKCICRTKIPAREKDKAKEKEAASKKKSKTNVEKVKKCTYHESNITCGPDCANPMKCIFPEKEDNEENLTLDKQFERMRPQLEEEYRFSQRKTCCDISPCPHSKKLDRHLEDPKPKGDGKKLGGKSSTALTSMNRTNSSTTQCMYGTMTMPSQNIKDACKTKTDLSVTSWKTRQDIMGLPLEKPSVSLIDIVRASRRNQSNETYCRTRRSSSFSYDSNMAGSSNKAPTFRNSSMYSGSILSEEEKNENVNNAMQFVNSVNPCACDMDIDDINRNPEETSRKSYKYVIQNSACSYTVLSTPKLPFQDTVKIMTSKRSSPKPELDSIESETLDTVTLNSESLSNNIQGEEESMRLVKRNKNQKKTTKTVARKRNIFKDEILLPCPDPKAMIICGIDLQPMPTPRNPKAIIVPIEDTEM